MAKTCGFCSFSTDDPAAFTDHMRTVHQWGVPAVAAVAPAAVLPPPAAEPGVPRFCGRCGAPRDAESTNFCRSCGTPFLGGPAAAVPAPSPAFAPKGGFWRRTGAYLLDSILLGFIGFGIGIAAGIIGIAAHMREDDYTIIAQAVAQLVNVAYFVYFWSNRGEGKTPGMRRFGVRVIRTNGDDLTLGRAFLRYIGLVLSILVLFLGVIWVGFDKNKQGWHDKIADTYVVRA